MLTLNVMNKILSRDSSDQESLFKAIQDAIRHTIESTLNSENVQSIRDQMYNLCYKSFCVPTQYHQWAMQEVDKAYESLRDDDKPACSTLSPVQEENPLLTKDTLYHASLCCQAVSTCTADNFKPFLNQTGHSLEAASMSISQDENGDRCMIAKQGSIVYMAFQSEPTLSRWFQSPYGNFADGTLAREIKCLWSWLKVLT